MNVAITIWGNRVSPVFDAAQTILLAEVRERIITKRRFERITIPAPVFIARKIVALEPDILICGAISEQPARIIEQSGISLLSFLSGRTEDVLYACAGKQEIIGYRMPGCRTMDSNDALPSSQETTRGIT